MSFDLSSFSDFFVGILEKVLATARHRIQLKALPMLIYALKWFIDPVFSLVFILEETGTVR